MVREGVDMNRINVNMGGMFVPFFLGCDDVAEDFVDFCNANHLDYDIEIVTLDEAKETQESLPAITSEIKNTLMQGFVTFLDKRNW